MSRGLAVTLAVAAVALLPATARGDGLPLPVDDAGPTGVTSPDGSTRYVTLPAASGAVVAKISTGSGTVLRSRALVGGFTIPVVALDSTPGGLSHDGSTLAVIRPRAGFPRSKTTLAFLDTQNLAMRGLYTLKGDFSFDALSPDGRTAYLIQYVDRTDPTKYRVRALQTATGGLSPRPIVDPHESADEMNGFPATRTTSPDGRWAYTLYDGAQDGRPFVHALDTKDGKAKCIDLPALGQDVYSLHLRATGGTLGIIGPKREVASVDLTSYKVSVPAQRAAAPAPGAARRRADPDSSAPAGLIAAIGVVLALAGAGLTLRRRRRGAVTPA